MKRRVALGALVVLAGVVSLAAALMLTGFVKSPEALATEWYYDLVQGDGEVVVGQVQVDNLDNPGTTLNVRYSTGSPWCLTEVHVCVSNLPFEWVAPGRMKCEAPPPKGLGGFWVGVDLDDDGCVMAHDVEIPLAELGGLGLLCPSVNIQAHAVVENGCGDEETAYGKEFKASFEQDLCYCPDS